MRLFIIFLCVWCVALSGCNRDVIRRVTIASLYYFAEREHVACGDLFEVPFAWQGIIEGQDTLARLANVMSRLQPIRNSVSECYGGDLVVAVEWRSSRRDTLCFVSVDMRINGECCFLDTTLLSEIATMLPPEHKQGIDSFLHEVYVRE